MTWEKTNFIILSGKRKSGKDYVAHQLSSRLSASGISVSIIHLSEPIKRAYARLNDLDPDLLMSSAAYKENYRTEMVRWGEERRTQDPGIFCREALDWVCTPSGPPAVVIVADARRPSDINFFGCISSPYRTPLHLRIFASEATRRARGWHPVPTVDEADTECALDDAPYDLLVVNEGSESLEKSMASVMSFLLKTLSV
uniref:Phosphomevalonate kinase n=1 Tax=Schistocephalus solidus TaxID=70667 RepID=A0A0X3Q0M4_SCHSO